MDENDLIIAAQSDPRRFEPLYNIYFLPVFRFVLKRTADRDTAGEITSIVFVKVLENIKNYRITKAKFSSWLFRIAYNVIQDHYRTNKISRTVHVSTDNIPDVFDEPDDNTAHTKKLERVIRIMSGLTTEEITLIELRFFEQRKFSEVAEILELSEGNARIRIHRIIEKIKNMLKQ